MEGIETLRLVKIQIYIYIACKGNKPDLNLTNKNVCKNQVLIASLR